MDLDSTKLTAPSSGSDDQLPMLPEPESTILKNHLKQVKISILLSSNLLPESNYNLIRNLGEQNNYTKFYCLFRLCN